MWRSFQRLRQLATTIRLPSPSKVLSSGRSFHSIIKPQMTTMLSPMLTNANSLLNTVTPQLQQSCGFKVKGRLKRRCKDCYFVVREERLYVICKTHPRHKQMSMKARDDKSWILTHATQSKVRPF